jgi:hypothetical protein
MHEMTADVQERVAVAQIGDDMSIPDFVEQGLTGHASFLPAASHCLASFADRYPTIFRGRPQRGTGGRKDRSAAPC